MDRMLVLLSLCALTTVHCVSFFPAEGSGKILSGPSRPYPPRPYPGQQQQQQQQHGQDLSGSDSNGGNGNYQHHPSISSVDMQLLAAMEKLVSRMDKLDTRVKTLENVVYSLTNKQKPEQGNCPTNFTQIEGIKGKCFHVSSLVNKDSVYDWQSASTECAKMNARLVEMITFEDFHRISRHLIKFGKLRNVAATDFWTGGLNPGLIWIWSESGKQVDLDRRFWNDNDNGSNAPGCLKLSFSLRLNTFFFKGSPCSQPQNFVCEIINNAVARALETYEKELSWAEEGNEELDEDL